MGFIKQIGSQAYVSMNVGSGIPQDAAELAALSLCVRE
jgi:hypothetical protein